MPQGDVEVFDQYMENTWDADIHDFGATPNDIYCAIVNNTIVPSQTTADPHWGGTGTTDLSVNEETGTNFPAGGKQCLTPTATLSAGELEVDFGDPTIWAKDAANPTACYWGIVYDNTVASKKCLGYVDLGGVFDATTGDLSVAWGAPFHTVDQAP